MRSSPLIRDHCDVAGRRQIELLDGGRIDLIPGYLQAPDAASLLSRLQASVEWEQPCITLFGRTSRIPRLNAWQADPGCDYSYSGTQLAHQPFSAELDSLRTRLNREFSLHLNSVLINWYRHGQDGMGWHQDNEKCLGSNPVIASLSLGDCRRFLLRPKGDKNRQNQIELQLGEGTLLVMSGTLQHGWQHCVPKTTRPRGTRINLTFRTILAATAVGAAPRHKPEQDGA